MQCSPLDESDTVTTNQPLKDRSVFINPCTQTPTSPTPRSCNAVAVPDLSPKSNIHNSHTPSAHCSLQARPPAPRPTRLSSTGRKPKTLSQTTSAFCRRPFVQQPSRQQVARKQLSQQRLSRQQPCQQRLFWQQPARWCGARGQKFECIICEQVRAEFRAIHRSKIFAQCIVQSGA